MTSLIVTPDLRQACPACFPGDRDALEPLSTVSTGATLRAAYRCPCGRSWSMRWSADSPWPEPVPLAELIPAGAGNPRDFSRTTGTGSPS